MLTVIYIRDGKRRQTDRKREIMSYSELCNTVSVCEASAEERKRKNSIVIRSKEI